uniref:G_PROTEIN_RECEP_F1_2 domain-containing protein n=1 Tax=Panagrellus redivivus TaxID=6233 RepID=A0A7E4ZSX3_PANRE
MSYPTEREPWSCDHRTHEEWVALGRPNLGIGIMYIGVGTFFLVGLDFYDYLFYFPAMFALLRSKLQRYPAFKIMTLLGFTDILALFDVSFACGWGAITGQIYCMSPIINRFFGTWVYFFWTVSSSTAVLLALTRFVELLDKKCGKTFFGGNKPFYWFGLIIVYAILLAIFGGKCVFSSYMYAVAYDPFYGMPERNGTVDLVNVS